MPSERLQPRSLERPRTFSRPQSAPFQAASQGRANGAPRSESRNIWIVGGQFFLSSEGRDVLNDAPVLEPVELIDPRSSAADQSGIDSPYAWMRLAASVALGTAGGVGMWSMPVVLPSVQAEFGVLRADASLPFTLTMLGFALGGVAMGRLQDRFGILAPALLGVGALSLGFFAASISPDLWTFALS
jgi:hypothetical protein